MQVKWRLAALGLLACTLLTVAVLTAYEAGRRSVADDPMAPLIVQAAPAAVTGRDLAVVELYELRNEAVVNITTETVVYNWFLEPMPREGGSGSGAIIDPSGYILTNYHVVEQASRVFIGFSDGERVEGEVIGHDAENDLAVIRIDPAGRDLTAIPLGDSAALRIGQSVYAIGNPFGLSRTLTTGVVSGLGRPLRARNDLVIRDMIQTDASINPGNSGGPLLDAGGNMVGINTLIFSPSGGSVGIGFAVPVNTARRVVSDLIEFGLVRRGWIDFIPRAISVELARFGELPVTEGLLLSEIVPGGNADRAGLRGGDRNRAVRSGRTVIFLGGDIVTEIDGQAVRSISNLYEALEDNRPGDRVTVRGIRGRRAFEVVVELSERPDRFVWE